MPLGHVVGQGAQLVGVVAVPVRRQVDRVAACEARITRMQGGSEVRRIKTAMEKKIRGLRMMGRASGDSSRSERGGEGMDSSTQGGARRAEHARAGRKDVNG